MPDPGQPTFINPNVTWNFLDARTKRTVSKDALTLADAVTAAGYVEVNGDYWKQGEEPKPVAPADES